MSTQTQTLPARRWMLVTRWRAVDDTVPLSQAYEDGSEDGAW